MKPFLCSYGGGHAQIMIAIARELMSRNVDFELLGFTSAHAAFHRAGLEALDVTALVEAGEDRPFFEAISKLRPVSDHPDISQAQTDAYYALGFRDLVRRKGETEAREALARHGRKAFEPVTVFARYFEKTSPSVVVATTSPRYEHAAIIAARQLGIPTLAVGDNYLLSEEARILSGRYAHHLSVIAVEIGERLLAAGLSGTKVHALGNPAFDTLVAQPGDKARRQRLRETFGIDDRTLILWPLGGSRAEVAGRHLLPADAVRAFLDRVCEQDNALAYMLRPHPNWPVDPIESSYGFLDATLSPEDAILMADVVCAESSTMGMQSALKGLPVICFNFADYVVYPELGWAGQTSSLRDLERMLVNRDFAPAPQHVTRLVGGATRRVCDLIEQIADIRPWHSVSR